ncbi:MAG TPA: hypothetical protein VGK73_30150 [Polyangiaceae bacterium]
MSQEGLVYWFSADFGLEQVAALWLWYGRSSNQEVASQIKYSAYPSIGTFAGSGRTALVFDGQDDHLALTAQAMSFVAGLTFFAVARTTSEEDCSPMLVLSNGAEIDDVSFFRHEQAFAYEVGFSRGHAGAFVAGAPLLLEVTHATDGSVSLFRNGLAIGAASIPLPPDITRENNFIGFASYTPCSTWSGELAEVLLYARVLPPNEHQAIHSYLVEKWGCCTSPI